MPVTTFVLRDGRAEPLGSFSDLAAASAMLPAGVYTTLRTYEGDGVLLLDDHIRRLEESAGLQGRPTSIDPALCRAGLAAALRATGYAEARLRITLAPPELFVS